MGGKAFWMLCGGCKIILYWKIAEMEDRNLLPRNSSFGIYRGVGPEKTKDVDRFLEKLLFSGYRAYWQNVLK